MSQILVKNLSKTFRIAARRAGIAGAVAGLVQRRYREIRALDAVSFTIAKGELVGYIGPNGAGKSTTVKILAGILIPESGECMIDGRIPWKNRIEHVRRLGVVFGQRTQLWWDLPVIESFDLLRDIYRLSHSQYQTEKAQLIELLQLQTVLDIPVRQLSLGQRMRCDLAAALLHRPQILFLDEPTIGLDAISKLAVRDFVKAINRERQVTVILTTHDLDDIEALCTRLIVISHGQIVSDGSLTELRQTLKPERRLTIDLEDADLHFHDADVVILRREGNRVYLAFNPNQISAAELVRRIMSAYPVHDLYLENPPIEEIIAQFYASQHQEPPCDPI
jgi:ABC-2 type transport system ATP-binding protein